MKDLRQQLGKERLFVDGGMGTLLQARGLAAGQAPLLWNMTHPREVLQAQREYLKSGVDLITANTFGAHALALADEPYSVEEIITKGVRLAREACQLENSSAYVVLDIGPLGKMIEPLGPLTFDEAYDLFKEQVLIGVANEVDGILIETMIDTYELKAAVLAAQESSDVPVMATVALMEQGRLLNGADIICVNTLLEGLGIDALGVNCGAGPEELASYFAELVAVSSTPLIVSPNAGLPVTVDDRIEYPLTPQAFAELMLPLLESPVALAGGCCGTTPAHIAALIQVSQGLPLPSGKNKQQRRISSYAVTLDLDAETPLIDRRIDELNNEALTVACQEGNFELIVDEVFDALDEGAEVIGVSTLQEELNELVCLPALVKAVQEVARTPLLITSRDCTAFERALRLYNGCALVDLSLFLPEQREQARSIAGRYGAQELKTESWT